MSRRQKVLDATAHVVTDLLLRNRQADPELGVGEIDQAVAKGEVTVKEIVLVFERELQDKLDPMA
jgi:hypothetical protein